MNKSQIFMNVFDTIGIVEKLSRDVEESVGKIFIDFSGFFNTDAVLNHTLYTLGSIYANSEDEIEEIVDWINWFLYEKPLGKSRVSIECVDYMIDDVNDLINMFEEIYNK